MVAWDAWIGRSELRSDAIDQARLTRWLATLDRDPPSDDIVPQGFHWCLCTPEAPTATLGIDGHPKRDARGFLPPVPLPRRMWAASSLEFLRPLRVGETIERRSRIVSISEKQGGSGPLAFVEVEHEIGTADGLALREVQSIVYRGEAVGGAPAPGAAPPEIWPVERVITPSETLLFRYSALTFNSHRIHYDLPYATGVERYRGLVVHGPLTATLLLDLARRELGDNRLTRFAFRGESPAFAGDELRLALRMDGNEIALRAFAPDGRTVMSATAACA